MQNFLTENNQDYGVMLPELVRVCYKHVAPKDVEMHLKRLESGEKPNPIFATSTILNCDNSGIPFADLFCGAGGLSLGFELEGASCRFALDHDSSALETFAFNRAKNVQIMHVDIRTALHQQLLGVQVPLVIGGPPCQGFSLANQQPRENDPRNRLYEDFLEAASIFGAKAVVIENVPGLLKKWDAVHSDLQRRGYSSRVFLLEAEDFGVPQRRRRVFIVAIKDLAAGKTGSFLKQVVDGIEKQRGTWKKTSIDAALLGLPFLEAKSVSNATHLETDNFGFTIGQPSHSSNLYIDRVNHGFPLGFTYNHRSKYNNQRDISLFKCLRQGEDTTSDAFSKLNPYKNRDHIFKDKFFRLHAKRPSKTITAHMYYDCHMYIHPTQHRGLTPREAARVQGFPDQYVFLGKPNEWYRQIGNSVSPLVGRIVARAILSAIKNIF